jgi:hypothetical protein
MYVLWIRGRRPQTSWRQDSSGAGDQRDAPDSEVCWLQGELCIQAFHHRSTHNNAIASYKGGVWNVDILCYCPHRHLEMRRRQNTAMLEPRTQHAGYYKGSHVLCGPAKYAPPPKQSSRK